MDLNTVTSLIGSFGFPTVACLCLGWYVKHQTDTNREDVRLITEKHETEIKEVTTALNNNTLAIQKLCERIGGEENDAS